MIRYFLIIIYLLSFLSIKAQTKRQYSIEDADEHFHHGNFLMALPIYKEIYKKESNNVELNFKIAQCYLNTHINKTEAIKYLEFCTQSAKPTSEMYFKLGKAYSLANKLDDAIKAYEKCLSIDSKRKKIIDRQIEMCNNAKALIKRPVNVSFTNMGKDINSEFPDYYPFITADEQFLAFTTRRKGQTASRPEVDGYYASDIYMAVVENGVWGKATNPGAKINTPLDEQVVGLKPDGSEMLVYIDHIDKYGDIYSCEKKGGVWQKYKPFPEHINKEIEHSAIITPDGNTLFFVRGENREAQTDIFMSRKLPNGNWGPPFKLGEEVNTIYNEDFPFISSDGQTLYFSSEGHNSMGGFDLFKTTWNSETNTWTQAENLGYPINTTDEDRSISLTPANPRVGYISALRPGGQGDLDIYRIKFKDAEEKLTVYTGNIFLGDSLSKPKEYIAAVFAFNKATNEEYTFTPNPKTGKLLMALPAGNYEIVVTSAGYTDVKDKLFVTDIGSGISEETKTYRLLKK